MQADLEQELRDAMAAGRDDLVTEAAAEIPSPAAGRIIWEGIDRALNRRSGANAAQDGALAATVFAIPVVFVAGGRPGALISAILPDTHRLLQVLQAGGALGETRNVGLNEVLSADTSVGAFAPSKLYRLLRELESGRAQTWSDLIPAEIQLDSEHETVELRFVTGLAVSGAQAPSFLETGADIARWGMPLGHELRRQLQGDGVTLLALARPPSGLMGALHAGHQAREDVALQTFLSRTLREFRASVGEPEVLVAAVRPEAVGVHVNSPLDPSRAVAHQWILDPLDDVAVIAKSMLDLLAECRAERVTVHPAVMTVAEFQAVR
jgi:hypothetical protein